MLEKNVNNRSLVEIVSLEDLVPEDHLLRKIDASVDFSKLYEFVEDLYCEDNGRPSIDPVILFKMVLIQHLYGITSLRRVAHFSTLSYNFRKRFNRETVDKVFYWILDEIAEAGYLNTEAVFIDGTHIKANANTKKKIKEEVPIAAKRYADELLEEINEDREAHGKKPFSTDEDNDNNDNTPSKSKKKRDNTSKKKLKRRKKEAKKKTKETTKSTTDPESGLFVKGEHKKQFAYEAHTACDKNGFVLETEVTPGNVHDSVAFDDVYDKVVQNSAHSKESI